VISRVISPGELTAAIGVVFQYGAGNLSMCSINKSQHHAVCYDELNTYYGRNHLISIIAIIGALCI